MCHTPLQGEMSLIKLSALIFKAEIAGSRAQLLCGSMLMALSYTFSWVPWSALQTEITHASQTSVLPIAREAVTQIEEKKQFAGALTCSCTTPTKENLVLPAELNFLDWRCSTYLWHPDPRAADSLILRPSPSCQPPLSFWTVPGCHVAAADSETSVTTYFCSNKARAISSKKQMEGINLSFKHLE